MLADEICTTGLLGYEGEPQAIQNIIARIKSATKYILAPQFATVADGLMHDYGSLVRAFPFCRLPYPEIWIECAHQDRPSFAKAELHAPQFQSQPTRVGFLCTSTRPDLSAWKTHLFWKLNNPGRGQIGCNAATMATVFDMTQNLGHKTIVPNKIQSTHDIFPEYFTEKQAHPGWETATDNVRLAMMNHTNPSLPDYGLPELSFLFDQQAAKLLMELASSDWAGEAAFLLAVIGLMNARNTTEVAPVQMKKLNHARSKRGQLPLFEHHILKIHPRQEYRAAHAAAYGGNTLRALRAHFVCGHWKIRKTGIFFWHPFMRGNAERGTIDKDYELK